MKQILIIILTLKICSLSSQNKPLGGTSNIVNNVSNMLHDVCINKKFSIVFYIPQDSSFTLNSTNVAANYSLAMIINLLNTTFSNICVSFENCSTVVIPDYNYNNWREGPNDTLVAHNWYTAKTINFYITKEILAMGGEWFGHAGALPTATSQPRDIIVMRKDNLFAVNGANFNGSDLLHTMGHYFGLEHTYAELGTPANPPPPPGTAIFSHEYADGSNCATNGDQICDTEADPWPQNYRPPIPVVLPCYYKYGQKDGKGDFYVPPVDNIMASYFCACRFTQQQYNKMAGNILAKRMYLH